MTQDKELCFLWDNTIHGAIPAFEKFEAAFAFEKVFEHPYCPEEVDLKAYILKPNGDQKQISGFWYEGFQRVFAKWAGDIDFYTGKGLENPLFRPGTRRIPLLCNSAGQKSATALTGIRRRGSSLLR